MHCKNCGYALRTDYSYCPNCGAKVIRKRITFKNLLYDFTERFLNLDNAFIKTFFYLFRQPDDVIGGYIRGVRKKYMNPVSYFTIAVALGGLFVFLFRNVFTDAMDYSMNLGKSMNNDNPMANSLSDSINNAIFDYQQLFYILSIPLLAMVSKLIFIDKKQFNLSEHLIINLYGYSQMSICINVLYILFIWNSKIIFYISTFNIVFQIGYFTYVLKRLFKLGFGNMFIRLMLFLVVLAALFFVLIVGIGIYMALQPEFMEQIKAAQEANAT